MTDSIPSPAPYLYHLIDGEHSPVDSAYVRQYTVQEADEEGVSGIPLPYQLRTDSAVVLLLLVCFLLTSSILARGKKYIEERVKHFLSSGARVTYSDEPSASDQRYTLVLVMQTCMLVGLFIYDYFSDHDPLLFERVPRAVLLGSYILIALGYVFVKGILYAIVNGVFFTSAQNRSWQTAFYSVMAGVGLLLYPVALVLVCVGISPKILPFFCLFVIIITKILFFYKSVSNFFNNFRCSLHLILYLCALEIIPDFIAWKGVISANDILILKF
jgi:hypothetical protein